MPIIASRVSVTTSPTVLTNPVNGSLADSISAVVKNTGGASVYLGGVNVQSTDGLELAPGEIMNVDLMAGDILYGVTASGTVIVAVMKLRQ
jgi:hypothetical protein